MQTAIQQNQSGANEPLSGIGVLYKTAYCEAFRMAVKDYLTANYLIAYTSTGTNPVEYLCSSNLTEIPGSDPALLKQPVAENDIDTRFPTQLHQGLTRPTTFTGKICTALNNALRPDGSGNMYQNKYQTNGS